MVKTTYSRNFLFALGFPLLAAAVSLSAIALLPYNQMFLTNYAWLHVLLAVVSVAASITMVAVAWHSAQKRQLARASLIGLGFLPVAVLDLFHLLSYPNMPIFITLNSVSKATLFWVFARLWFGVTLCFVVCQKDTGVILKARRWFGYVALAFLGLATVGTFVGIRLLPASFFPGSGLAMPYAVLVFVAFALHLVATVSFLLTHRHSFDKLLVPQVTSALLLSSIGVLFLLLSRQAGDLPDLVSHFFQASAYVIIAQSLIYLLVQRARQELARSHEVLRKTEQLAILGLMAGRLAHEVRNPLTAMRACAQLGQMQTKEDKAGEMFGRIVSQVDQVNSLVNSSLDFARLNSGKQETVDLRSLLNDILQTWHPEAAARQIGFAVELGNQPLLTTGRVDLLRQAIGNIILNALQAMGSGGTLKMQAEASPSEVTISISDTGPGISPEIQSRLFEDFVTTKENGTGLGLTVTREILTNHGGKISFTTSEKGTTFLISLHRSSASEQESAVTQEA